MASPTRNKSIILSRIEQGEFEVGRDGEIWRLHRWYKCGHKNKTRCKKIVERKRIECLHRRGYLIIRARINLNVISVMAHRVVWIYFHGPIPPRLQINHKNGIKVDNRPSNLELMTCKENVHHAIDILGTRDKFIGGNNGNAKLCDKDIILIRQMLVHGGFSQAKIARLFMIRPATICDIKYRRRWAHI